MLQDSEVDSLLSLPIYGLDSEARHALLIEKMRDVTRHHITNCAPYRKLCEVNQVDVDSLTRLEDFPYLPAALFKDALLLSIPESDVFREVRSSATSSGRPSRIGLNKANNRRWTRSMQRMLVDRIGDERLRMMVLDEPSVLGRGAVLSARASMTRSLMFAASDTAACLEETSGLLRLDTEKLEQFLDDIGDGDGAMLFGFTFILYAQVAAPLLKAGRRFSVPKLKIIHAGGWKKLESAKVSREKLIEDCGVCFGVPPENVIDLYGFTEQGGLLYPTCEEGVRHTPAWGAVIARDPTTLEPLPLGEPGLLQFLTPLQTAYPGHSVITEDVGVVLGRDDCPCGRLGARFVVYGRSETAVEERGCGDIMAEMFA